MEDKEKILLSVSVRNYRTTLDRLDSVFESVSQSKIEVYLQDMLQVGSVEREESKSTLRRSEAEFWEFFSLF